MRVLFLDHPEADFLAAVLYLGLHQELGEGGVVEYPYKPSYHGDVHRYPSSHVADYFPGQEPSGTTSPFAWMPALPGACWQEDEVMQALSDRRFDLVVVASPRRNNVRDARSLLARVGTGKRPTVVLCDGEDYQDMRWDLVCALSPHVYFKRELVGSPARDGLRVEPFPFGSPVPVHAPEEKIVDVLFLGGGTWGGRAAACDALRAEFGAGFFGGVGHHIDYAGYLSAINRSRVAVSVRGFGLDTLRYWEIPSFETLLVCDRIPLRKPHPFEDGVHALYFDGPQDLVAKVKQALSDEPRARRIAKAGNAHLRAHHTARARARQLLEISVAYHAP